jgi:hypothetical protein
MLNGDNIRRASTTGEVALAVQLLHILCKSGEGAAPVVKLGLTSTNLHCGPSMSACCPSGWAEGG